MIVTPGVLGGFKGFFPTIQLRHLTVADIPELIAATEIGGTQRLQLPRRARELIENSLDLISANVRLPCMQTSRGRHSSEQFAALRQRVDCRILTDVDPEFDSARRVWNGMIDRRPAAIVKATSIADVMLTVQFCRENDISASVRGGGHSAAGKAVADGALMIDLSSMRGVQVDPERRKAVVQGGATWGIFDEACEEYKLATTGGVISSTGVCGLALGGGIGWLMGKHGLSCDNVISADVVSANGEHLSASARENQDLFWAIRGGGGNFGIITALEFDLHELIQVHGGVMLYPRRHAVDLLRQYREITMRAEDELTAYAALLIGDGQPLAAVAVCHSGSPSDGAEACQKFQLATPPIADMTGEKRYTEIQTMLDFTAPAGRHYYFKCPFLCDLTDDAIYTIVDYADMMPSGSTQIILEHMHGAASRIPASETAFGLRRVHYSINIVPAWDRRSDAEECVAWAQGLAKLLERFGALDSYVNYLGEEGVHSVRASYGPNYERLAQLKKKYDPDNFFHFNQNIPPAA